MELAWFGTLGPAYNEFSDNKHQAIMINFFPHKKSLLIDINVKKKSSYNEYHL